VVDAFDPVLIALMHAIDAQISWLVIRRWNAPLADGSPVQYGLSLKVWPCFQHGMSLKRWVWVDHPRMENNMNETKLTTIGQIREFLAGTADVYLAPEDDDNARYAFIATCCRASTTHGWGVLITGPGIFRLDGRPRRGDDSGVYSRAGSRKQAIRSTDAVAPRGHLQVAH
jgi:hypothetical protein